MSGETQEMEALHPHGSLVEQVHRVITTDQGVDAWVIAEEAVKFVRERVAREIHSLTQDCDPNDMKRSAHNSAIYAHIADRIRHPEKYSGTASGVSS